MAQLWGGRFTKETDKLVYNFNASIGFDQKFYCPGYPWQQGTCNNAGQAGYSDHGRKTRDHLVALDGIRTRCWKTEPCRSPKNMKIFTAS